MDYSFRFQNTLDNSNSQLDKYWQEIGVPSFYQNFRGNTKLPKTFFAKVDNQEKIIQLFKLKGFQFGNWLVTDDKSNYLMASVQCLYDLNKILGFNYNVGINGNLGISFGARGKSGALAHYEPGTDIINLTRYIRPFKETRYKETNLRKDKDWIKDKNWRFINSGGSGSFAHEYGHFLDYHFGLVGEPDKKRKYHALTGGSSTRRDDLECTKGGMRDLTNQILHVCYWKDKEKKHASTYYTKLVEDFQNPYWVQRNEVFARAFEQYVHLKLSKMIVNNSFLTKRKYKSTVYLSLAQLKKVEKLFDKLVKQMAQLL